MPALPLSIDPSLASMYLTRLTRGSFPSLVGLPSPRSSQIGPNMWISAGALPPSVFPPLSSHPFSQADSSFQRQLHSSIPGGFSCVLILPSLLTVLHLHYPGEFSHADSVFSSLPFLCLSIKTRLPVVSYPRFFFPMQRLTTPKLHANTHHSFFSNFLCETVLCWQVPIVL